MCVKERATGRNDDSRYNPLLHRLQVINEAFKLRLHRKMRLGEQ